VPSPLPALPALPVVTVTTGEALDGRSVHKPRVRQRLVDAALELFAGKGFEATSVEEIAERAGVSPRTFFRYFATKDQVLFFGGEDFNAAVVRALPGQPPELDDLSAVAATMQELVPLVVPLKPRILLFFRAVDGSLVVAGKHAQATAGHQAALARALAARRGLPDPDGRCLLAAALAGVAMNRAYAEWLDSGRDLVALTSESFALLRDVAAAG